MYPGGIPRYGDLSRMSYSPNMPGISTGNMMIDMVISSMMGNRNFSAMPGQGQGVFDAYLSQQRSRQFIQAQQHGFGSVLPFQKLGGFGTGGVAQGMSMLLGSPDGIMNSAFARAINGGNPIKQMMGLTAGMTGQTMNMAYGNPANATFNQVKAAFDGQNNAMFSHKIFEQKDFDAGYANTGKRLAKSLMSSTAGAGLFGDAINKDSQGEYTVDFEKIKKNSTKYFKLARESGNQAVIDSYNEVFDTTEGVEKLRKQIGTKVKDKVNFSVTRGFESHDINSALLMGKELGMVFSKNRFAKNYEPNEKDIRETEESATKNAVVVMDAMKDLTGTSSATGLMSEINNFMGRGQLSLTNSEQTKDIEKLLRQFKGAARAAGISIESVMGIHAATQELADRFPQLRYRSGTALANSNISAIQSTSAMTSQLGPDWARHNGGQAKILENISASNVMATDEIFIKETAGMAAMINQSSLSDTDKSALLDDLKSTLGSGDLVDPGVAMAMKSRIATKLGTSTAAVMETGRSLAAQRSGFSFFAEEELQGRGWNIPGAMNALTVKDMHMLAATDKLDLSGFDADLLTGMRWDDAAVKHGLTQRRRFDSINNDEAYQLRYTEGVLMNNPNSKYARERASLAASGNAYAKDAAMFAERGGMLKAGLSPVIMQQILGGDIDAGLTQLKEAFTNTDQKVRADNILRATRNVADEGTTMSIKEAMLERAGGLNVGSTEELRKNLKTQGVSDADIELRIKQHDRLKSNDEWENLDAVGGLSMNDIINSSKSDEAWNRSRAAAMNFDKSKVNRAAAFLNESGLSEHARGMGSQSWNQAKQGMAIGSGVSEAARMGAAEDLQKINTSVDVNFEEQMSRLQSSDPSMYAEYHNAVTALGPDLLKTDATGSYDGAEILKRAYAPEDPKNPDTPAQKAAKEKLQKNAVISSARTNIDDLTKTANEAGASAEKMMVDEFGKLSKQIGDSSGSIASAISQLVNMLGNFTTVKG